jgi:hypothetical protein
MILDLNGIIFLNSVNKLMAVMVECVVFEIRAELLNII